MERIVELILQKKFGKFFYGIDHKHIHVGLFNGEFTIEGIGLQPDVFNSLNLPIVLKYSFVEKMQVKYAWREQQSNLIINIENIYAIVTPKEESEYKFAETLQRSKQELIKEVIREFLNKEKEAQKKGKERSGLENMVFKMLDNIYLRIKHIHIRYQHASERFSFGVTINEILVETRDAQGRKYYFQREKSQEKYVNQVLEVNGFGVYWNSSETNLLVGLAPADITNNMYGLSIGGLFADENALEQGNNGRTGEPRLRYIININMFCSLKKYLASEDLSSPEYECEVKFQQIEAKVTHDQYSQIMKLVQSFLAYQVQWKTVHQFSELQNYKLKSAREVLNMMRAKKYAYQGDQSQYITKYVRAYLSWIFRSVRERYIMKKFVSLVIQKPITYENIRSSPELRRIIHKTESDKIKQWLKIALRFKADFEREAPKIRIDRAEYLNIKLEATLHQASRGNDRKSQREEEQATINTDENNYIWFKLRISIDSGHCELSKGDFGLLCAWSGLYSELFLRKSNFFVEISMIDFNIKLFDSWGTGGRAYVDLLKKTSVLDYNVQKNRLLTIQFEKNPIAKPYVFTETSLELRSIELTAFPSSLKRIYEILSEAVKKEPSEPHPEPPKQQNLKTERELESEATIKAISFQRNIIDAKIHSPWIIIPFSKVNDKKSECWVVRLGDFSIKTPLDNDVYFSTKVKEEELYYEYYEMALKNFELKYYSSIYFFYSCLKFGGKAKMAQLLDNKLMEGGSMIDVIKPFSSSLGIYMLKKHLSSSIRDNNFGLKCNLGIGTIDVSLSSFVLAKLKSLFEEFKKDENPQFLQHDKQDILQGASLKGMLSIRYGKFSNMRFYGVLAGQQLYLFLTELSRNHQLQLNLADTKIKLIDTEHLATQVTLNSQCKELLELFFETSAEMNRWVTHLSRCLTNGKEPNRLEARQFRSQSKLPNAGELRSRQNVSEPPMKKESKYHLKLTIEQLQLSLYDQSSQFLNCHIRNMTFNMIQLVRKGFDLCIHQIHLTEPSHRMKVLLSSKNLGALHESPKFLDLKVMCDEVGAVREVDLNFQDILIVWKITVIQKVISFFFLESDGPAVPPAPNTRKRIIEITANMQRMHLIFAHNEHLTGILKILDSRMVYKTTVNSETYNYNAARMEVFNYENNDTSKEIPLFRVRTSSTGHRFEVFYSAGRAVEHSESPLRRSATNSVFSGDTSSYITASELVMTISGYQIHYMHEQFMRLFNYFTNKFMGSLSSKFKVKREYTPEYIYESMKTKRNGSMRVQLLDCVLKLVDTADSQEHLRMEIPRLVVHKNFDPRYEATVRMVDTKKGPMLIPYEKLVVNMQQMDLYYIHERRHERLKLNNLHPINLLVQYNKWNLQRDYFPVLHSIDDIDRTITVHIDFNQQLDLNLQKIAFYMIMKIYYRNMKHKDGLAEEYEPAAPYATPRQYKVRIPDLILRLSEFNDATFRQFASVQLPRFRVDARQVRTLINFNIRAEQVFVRYDDQAAADTVVEVYNKQEQSIFNIDMQSDRGTINSDIMLQNYKVSLDMNQIDALVDYFDFDQNDVENRRMPKKTTKSFQNFRITWKDGIAVATTGNDILGLSGLVYVSLSKNPGSEWDRELVEFLGEGLTPMDVNEKELKVNAEKISVYMNATKVTELPNFLYTRNEFSARKMGRRHRRENILLQSMDLCFFMSYIKILQKLYKQRIKKVKVKKSYFDPAAGIKPKIKYDDKRMYSIEGEPVGVVVMHPHQDGCYPAAKLTLDFKRLLIGMRTSVVKHISAMFDMKLLNRGPNFSFAPILEARNMSITYDSDNGIKRVQVGENFIDLNTFNVNEAIVNEVMKGGSSILTQTPSTSYAKLINDTDSQVGIELGFAGKVLFHEKLHRYETKEVILSHYHYCRLYAEQQPYVKVGLLQQSLQANVSLATIDCRRLLSLEDRYYLSVGHEGALTIRLMSQFKLENKTSLRFRYRLREGKNSSKSMLILEPMSSVNVSFSVGRQLVLLEEASQEEAVIGYSNKFEHRVNYNYRLRLGHSSMSTLMLTPKILLTNLIPLRLSLGNSKLHLELLPFQTVEVAEHSFRAKKEVQLQLGGSKFKCSTSLFFESSRKGKPNLLELTSFEGRVSYTLELEILEKDDSFIWLLKPQIVLSNLTGALLQLLRDQRLFDLAENCSLIGNRQEPFVIRAAHQFKLHANSLKLKEEVQHNDLVMVLVNLNHEGTKTPTVLVYSEVTLLNHTKHPFVLDDGYRTVASHTSSTVTLRPAETLRLAIGPSSKELSFEGRDDIYFYLPLPSSSRSDVNRVFLRAEIARLQKRKLIKIAEEPSPSRYWIKNNLKDFTLVVRQLGSNPQDHFIVPECSERGVSPEDPSKPDSFEIEFYYNLKNIDFNRKLLLAPREMPKLTMLQLDEQGVHFSFRFTFEKGKSSYTLTVDQVEDPSVEQPTIFEIAISRLLFNLRFSPEDHEHRSMSLLLEQLKAKVTKVANQTAYELLLENLSAQYKKNRVLSKHRRDAPFLDVSATTDKSLAFTKVEEAQIALASLDINIQEQFLYETASFLKKFELLGAKKTPNKEKNMRVMELLRSGDRKYLGEIHELELDEGRKLRKKEDPHIFVSSLRLRPVTIVLSYLKGDSFNASEFRTHNLLKYLTVIPNIKELKIPVGELSLQQQDGTQKSVQKKITSHLKKSIPVSVGSSISSLSVLENPVEAIDTIGGIVNGIWSII